MSEPVVSIIIPCFNEEKTIGLLLDAIRGQTFDQDQLEVVIADANSTDSTRNVVADYQSSHPAMKITVVENPKRIIPSGLNEALRNARGKIITRMDAHSIPAADYVELSVKNLLDGKGANIGGVIDIRPGSETWIGRSIAIATSHPLGVGDARYRWTKDAGPAETVAFGTFHRELFDQIGYYDESLEINEDYELNHRIRQSGKQVWIDPRIRAIYYSRGNLRSLTRQYFSYGYWKVKMLRRYPRSLRWRQALPPLFVFGLLMLLLGSIFWTFARILLLIVLGVYLASLAAGSIPAARRARNGLLMFGVPAAIMTMHLSWGSGFIWSFLHNESRT